MKNQSLLATILVVGVFVVTGVIYWCSSGYGKVSGDAYEVAKALYSSCLSKSDERLDLVVELLEGEGDNEPLEITDRERRWLDSMIQKARSGDWETAANSARQMMEDQVEH